MSNHSKQVKGKLNKEIIDIIYNAEDFLSDGYGYYNEEHGVKMISTSFKKLIKEYAKNAFLFHLKVNDSRKLDEKAFGEYWKGVTK